MERDLSTEKWGFEGLNPDLIRHILWERLRRAKREPRVNTTHTPKSGRRIIWLHVLTVVSATILIGAEVFGAAFAGSWAVASLFNLGDIGARILDALFMLCGIAIMAQFVRAARRVEPFTAER